MRWWWPRMRNRSAPSAPSPEVVAAREELAEAVAAREESEHALNGSPARDAAVRAEARYWRRRRVMNSYAETWIQAIGDDGTSGARP